MKVILEGSEKKINRLRRELKSRLRNDNIILKEEEQQTPEVQEAPKKTRKNK